MYIAKFLLFLLFIAFTAMPIPALAQVVSSGPDDKLVDRPEEVYATLENVANWMFSIFLTIAVIMIIYAAFVYITAGGGENVSKAHKMLIYAVVAIAVAFLARGFDDIVSSILVKK